MVKRHLPASSQAKAGGSILFYEDFANGLAGNTTFGAWSVAGADSALWEHDFDGSQGQFSTFQDTLLSASSANGWMMFDVDAANPNPVFYGVGNEGYLISPVIDLTGSPYVHLEMDHRFRFCCSYAFKLRVAVTTDGFQTVTKFVLSDPWLRNELPPNPVNSSISISGALVGGNMANVQLRFEWEGLLLDGNNQGTNEYFWMLDDVTLRETLADDIAITQAEYADWAGAGELEYSVFPFSQLRPITFAGWALNNGYNTQTNVTMNVDVTGNGSSFMTNSLPMDIGVLGNDTLLSTTTFTPPAATDTFSINYSLVQDQLDLAPLNNDTVGGFAVGEFTYARDLGEMEGTFNNGELGEPFYLCTGFDIVNNTTLYAIDVVLTPATDMGLEFDAMLFDVNHGFVGESFSSHVVGPGDTSSFDGALNWLRIVFDTPQVLSGGEFYFACIRHYGGDTIGIALSGRAKSGTCQSYENNADSWYNGGKIPMIRMNFDPSVGIAEQESGPLQGVSASPNPFSSVTTIAYTLQERTNMSLLVTDAAGRTVHVEQLGMQQIGPHSVPFDGAELDAGMYFYTLQSTSANVTKCLVVQH